MKRTGLVCAWLVLGAAVVNAEEKLAPVGLLTPEEEAKSFILPAGLHAEVVAAEPQVEHPVAIAFDPRGRMWVAEMRGYMPNLEGTGELKPTGRVSVLEDTDGDGRMDKSTVFLDGLVLPRAVAFAGDGVLIGTPPDLLFCRDTNGDDRCDERKVIATDFGVSENPENSANGLVYGLDNWVYSACWGTRLRYKGNGQFELSPVPVMGQFGMTRDDWGRWYFNTNSDSLRAALVPPHYSIRNPQSRMSLADTRIAKDQTIWPTHAATVNRGYREGFLRDGKLAEFTAACGPSVYRADLFPSDWYGNVFVCEATSSMIRRDVLTEDGLGLSVKNAYDAREFLTSDYERFRPVNTATGPDGALYVVDMHHGIIQHKMSLTEYAKDQYREKKLDKHLLTGRVFRIVPDTAKPAIHVDLTKASTQDLVGTLAHPNGWWRDTAQRLLVERNDESAVGPLKAMAAATEQSPVHRLNALWTLQGMGRLDPDDVRKALADRDPHVRASGVRLSESLASNADLLAAVFKLANDQSPIVRVQVMLSVSGLATDEADAMVARILHEQGGDAAMREAAVSGLGGREVSFLTRLSADPDWDQRNTARAAAITDIARSVIRRDHPAEVIALVDLIGSDKVHDWQRTALVAAIPTKRQDNFGLENWIDVDKEPAAVALLKASADPAACKSADRVAALFRWPGKVMPERPKAAPLTAKQQELFELGRTTYTTLCGQCHQPDGRGQEGKAPPLAGSPWAVGPEGRLIRIVLHGVRGPVTVGDRTFNLDMPGLKVLSDDQIAGVLTYIRRSWGHEASAVDPSVVQNIRDWNQARRDGWTEPELLKIK